MPTSMPLRSRRVVQFAISVVCFAAFFTLAAVVGRAPDPASLMTLESTLVNHGTLIAWWFTWLGYSYALVPLVLGLLVLAWRVPSWRVRVIFSIVVLLLCWQGADVFQEVFARPRRLDWVVKHETAFGFPSSHASIATGFYLLWSAFLLQSSLARRAFSAAIPAVAAAGIIWSRLALAAHYGTDVLGGVLLACAIVTLGAAVLPINVFGRTEERP
ncbi:MAG: phosphatase PAP2 family protein [Candidatus Eremiobacteraeota bacterium]|nr:phosphatase PAP2 family protein [Candidatus Eremiobacteraeota bacterium]